NREYAAALSLGLGLESESELTSPAEIYALRVLLARSYVATQDPQASDYFNSACQLLASQDYAASEDHAAQLTAIRKEHAHALRNLGDWSGAMAAYSEARRTDRDKGDLLVLSTDIAELMMQGGAYEAALAELGKTAQDLRCVLPSLYETW